MDREKITLPISLTYNNDNTTTTTTTTSLLTITISTDIARYTRNSVPAFGLWKPYDFLVGSQRSAFSSTGARRGRRRRGGYAASSPERFDHVTASDGRRKTRRARGRRQEQNKKKKNRETDAALCAGPFNYGPTRVYCCSLIVVIIRITIVLRAPIRVFDSSEPGVSEEQ